MLVQTSWVFAEMVTYTHTTQISFSVANIHLYLRITWQNNEQVV